MLAVSTNLILEAALTSQDCLFPTMSGSLLTAFDRLRSLSGSVTWKPLVNLSRSTVLSLLQGIGIGQLTIYESDGTKTICGSSTVPATELHVLKEVFWLRLALYADMVRLHVALSSL